VLFPPKLVSWRRAPFVAVAALAFGLGWLYGDGVLTPQAAGSPAEAGSTAGPRAAKVLHELAAGLPSALSASRTALLGSGDPGEAGQITVSRSGHVLTLPYHPQGGPGARMVYLHGTAPRNLPALCRWRQRELRALLGQWRETNRSAAQSVEALHHAARRLADLLRNPPAAPLVDVPALMPTATNRPAQCLQRVCQAVADGDRPAAAAWATELSAALFALADLHRWTDLLYDNHLASLDFATRCPEVLAYADGKLGEGLLRLNEWLPSYSLLMPRIHNYLAVERQARGLLAADGDGPAGRKPCADPAAVYMPPTLREAFLQLRAPLQPATRRLWDRAARTPYERSYLANTLYRLGQGSKRDRLHIVLERFERSNPAPALPGLMDVLCYRSSVTECVEPGDRYDERLMSTSARLPGTDRAVFQRAHLLTRKVLNGWSGYQGGVWTLREGLDRGRLDCVRGSDLIGALYRNAGRSGFHLVRITCGSAAHTVCGIRAPGGAGPVVLLDALTDDPAGRTWPAAFFEGFAWPEGVPCETGPAFAVELYARGLDNYVFAEGYVVRGRHAGELLRARLPYLPGRGTSGTEKVFPGPFPPVPSETKTTAAVPAQEHRALAVPAFRPW